MKNPENPTLYASLLESRSRRSCFSSFKLSTIWQKAQLVLILPMAISWTLVEDFDSINSTMAVDFAAGCTGGAHEYRCLSLGIMERLFTSYPNHVQKVQAAFLHSITGSFQNKVENIKNVFSAPFLFSAFYPYWNYSIFSRIRITKLYTVKIQLQRF